MRKPEPAGLRVAQLGHPDPVIQDRRLQDAPGFTSSGSLPSPPGAPGVKSYGRRHSPAGQSACPWANALHRGRPPPAPRRPAISTRHWPGRRSESANLGCHPSAHRLWLRCPRCCRRHANIRSIAARLHGRRHRRRLSRSQRSPKLPSHLKLCLALAPASGITTFELTASVASRRFAAQQSHPHASVSPSRVRCTSAPRASRPLQVACKSRESHRRKQRPVSEPAPRQLDQRRPKS